MTTAPNRPIPREQIELVEALLKGMPRCDLERLAAPLRPAVTVGEAGEASLVMLGLIDAELERNAPR